MKLSYITRVAVCVMSVVAYLSGGMLSRAAVLTPVDLSQAANMGFRDSVSGDGKGGWMDQGGNDLRFLPTGRQTFLGVDFDVVDPAVNDGKSCIVLYGESRPYFPVEREVVVGKKARSIYFLHGAGWCSENSVGATYTVVYEDGSDVAIPIRGNWEISNWWGPQDGKLSRPAWVGANLHTSQVGIHFFPWQNPHPDKTIASIRFTSAKSRMIVAVVAVTLSDEDAVLPPPTPTQSGNDLDFQAGRAATIGMKKVVGEVRPEDLLPPVEYDKNAYIPAANRHIHAVLQATGRQDNDEKLPMGGVADVSFLNDKPAGKHGYLDVKDGKLQFEDGTPARFMCTSSTYGIQYPENMEMARKYARWLAANGVNWVRLHHFAHSGKTGMSLFDFWKDTPEGTKDRLNGNVNHRLCNTRDYDMEAWNKFDMFLAACREEGIYIHVSGVVFSWFGFLDAVENSIPPRGTASQAYRTEGAQLFIREYIEKINKYWTDLMTHRNPHTGLRYVDDPAIAGVELVNEDSVFWRGCDPNRLSGYYYMELHERWNNWLLEEYGSPEGLREAWGDAVMEDWEKPLRDINFMKAGRTIPEPGRFTRVVEGFRTVDLSAAVNTTYTDQFEADGKGGWADHGKDSDMRFFPTGNLLLLGIPFDVDEKGPVLIADRDSFADVGRGQGKRPNPKRQNNWEKSASFPMKGKARCLYILHTAGWMAGGTQPFGHYDVTYGDGTVVSIDIRKGIDIADWSDPANGENMRIAWRGMSLGAQDIGVSLLAWDNPHPEKPISGITARTEGSGAIVCILGVTMSDAPASLPAIAEMPSLPEWKRFVRLWPYAGRFERDGWTPELLKRGSDQIRFLHGVQTDYFLSQKRFFRDTLGFKGLICGSNWKTPPLMKEADLHSNARLDVLDRHNYGGSNGFMRNPGCGTMTSGLERIFGKPLMISEYYIRREEAYRCSVFPLISLYGQGLNGWEFPTRFAVRRSGWGFYEHWDAGINYPSIISQFPAMALAVRRGDITEGPEVYRRMLSLDEVMARKIDAEHPYDLKYFAVGKVGTEYTDAVTPDVVDEKTIAANWDKERGIVRSATGELVWDYEKGIASCHSARTQGAVGFLSRETPIKLPAAELEIETPFAAVWLSSLDGKDLTKSGKVLVTLTARDVAQEDEKGKALTYHGVLVESVAGRISFDSDLSETLNVYAMDWDGLPVRKLEPTVEGRRLRFGFDTLAFRGPYLCFTTEDMKIKQVVHVAPVVPEALRAR